MRSVASLIAFTSKMIDGAVASLRSVSSKRPMRSISSEETPSAARTHTSHTDVKPSALPPRSGRNRATAS